MKHDSKPEIQIMIQEYLSTIGILERRLATTEAQIDAVVSRCRELVSQRNLLLEALEYHQEHTRPIQQSIDVINLVKYQT